MPMHPLPITLKWQYSDGHWHEYSSKFSERISELYNIKTIEPNIVNLQVWYEGSLLVERKSKDH